MLVSGIRKPFVVALLPHVLDGNKVAGVPLSVQGRKDLGRFLSVLGLDVDAAFVALLVDGDVKDESVVAGGTALKDFLLDLPDPSCLRASADGVPGCHGLLVEHVTHFEARGRRHGRGCHAFAEAAEGRALPGGRG